MKNLKINGKETITKIMKNIMPFLTIIFLLLQPVSMAESLGDDYINETKSAYIDNLMDKLADVVANETIFDEEFDNEFLLSSDFFHETYCNQEYIDWAYDSTCNEEVINNTLEIICALNETACNNETLKETMRMELNETYCNRTLIEKSICEYNGTIVGDTIKLTEGATCNEFFVDEIYNETCSEEFLAEINETLCAEDPDNASICNNQTLLNELSEEFFCNITFINETLCEITLNETEVVEMYHDLFRESYLEVYAEESWDEYIMDLNRSYVGFSPNYPFPEPIEPYNTQKTTSKVSPKKVWTKVSAQASPKVAAKIPAKVAATVTAPVAPKVGGVNMGSNVGSNLGAKIAAKLSPPPKPGTPVLVGPGMPLSPLGIGIKWGGIPVLKSICNTILKGEAPSISSVLKGVSRSTVINVVKAIITPPALVSAAISIGNTIGAGIAAGLGAGVIASTLCITILAVSCGYWLTHPPIHSHLANKVMTIIMRISATIGAVIGAKIGAKMGAKVGAKIGGISVNISAEGLENLTDIEAIMYDPYLGELIFIGEQNYSVNESISLDDFKTALEVQKEDQWVSIEVTDNTSGMASVIFGNLYSLLGYPTLWNTSMGSKLLNGDYLLKNQTIDRTYECFCDGGCLNNITFWIWIKPSKVDLNNNGGIFNYKKVDIDSYYSGQCSGDDCICIEGCWNDSANYIGDNFETLAEQHSEYKGVVDAVKAAALANWIKAQGIDHSWFLNDFESVPVYTPSNVTAHSPPNSDGFIHPDGGVGFNEFGNTYVKDQNLKELSRAALLSRPHESEVVWDVEFNGKTYTAVALSLGGQKEDNYSIDFNTDHYRDNLDGGAFVSSIMPFGTAITPDSTMNLNLSVYGKDTGADVKVKLVPLDSAPIESREVIVSQNVSSNPSIFCSPAGSDCTLDTGSEGYFESVSVTWSGNGGADCRTATGSHGETEVSKDGVDWDESSSIHTGIWGSSGTFPVGDYYRYVRWHCYDCRTASGSVNISVSKKDVFATWEPPTVYNTNLQLPDNLTRGSYQIYTETYINGTLEDIAVSDLIYYTPIDGSDVPYNAEEYVYNATNNSIIDGDCYGDGNLSDCYMQVNYVKRDGNDIEFSFNLTGAGDGMIYANGNLIGNLSFYRENYTFTIPNLGADEINIISIKIFDHEEGEYYVLNISVSPNQTDWWNTNWNYRKPITLDSEEPLTDYQILITLDPTNFNFSKANPDGSDIRFIHENNELNHWIESWSSTEAKVWVKVNLTGTKEIYMYYGNPDVYIEEEEPVIYEDWESGTIDSKWMSGGNQPFIISGTAYEGSYSAGNGDIGDSQSSYIQTTVNLTQQTELSFYWKVSSESNYDYLMFYIDGVQNAAISGSVDWNKQSYLLSEGVHTLKWAYTKDGSVSSGSDMGWVDMIELKNAIQNNVTSTGDKVFEFFDDAEIGWDKWTSHDGWSLSTGGYAHSGIYGFNSYPVGSLTERNMYSQDIDLTDFSGQVNLTFWYRNKKLCNGCSYCKHYVYASSDGVTWNELRYYSSSHTSWTYDNIDVSGYSGGMLYIRFRYYSYYARWFDGYGLNVDDIRIIKVALQEPIVSIGEEESKPTERDYIAQIIVNITISGGVYYEACSQMYYSNQIGIWHGIPNEYYYSILSQDSNLKVTKVSKSTCTGQQCPYYVSRICFTDGAIYSGDDIFARVGVFGVSKGSTGTIDYERRLQIECDMNDIVVSPDRGSIDSEFVNCPGCTFSVGDADINSQAQSLVGANDLETIENIANWISKNIDYNENGYQTAVDVFDINNCEGSDRGITHLFLAMLRSQGIPARAAWGMRYGGSGWNEHVWAEVYLGSEWVPVDPTYNRVGTDVGCGQISFIKSLENPVGSLEDLTKITTSNIRTHSEGVNLPVMEFIEVFYEPIPDDGFIKYRKKCDWAYNQCTLDVGSDKDIHHINIQFSPSTHPAGYSQTSSMNPYAPWVSVSDGSWTTVASDIWWGNDASYIIDIDGTTYDGNYQYVQWSYSPYGYTRIHAVDIIAYVNP